MPQHHAMMALSKQGTCLGQKGMKVKGEGRTPDATAAQLQVTVACDEMSGARLHP